MVPAALARACAGCARRTTCSWCAARACWACPALVAARALGKRVVLQPEVNGEMTRRGLHLGHAARPGLAAARGLRRGRGRATVLLRDADAFVAMSRAIRDEFLAAGRPAAEGRAHPARRGHERFRPATAGRARGAARAPRACPPTAAIVIYTGRLLRGKGLEDAARPPSRRRGRRARRAPPDRGLRRRARPSPSKTTLRAARAGGRARRARHLHRPRRRRGGLAARRGRVRVPVPLRGARHLARRGGGLRPARGGVAHGRHRGRGRGRRVGAARPARRRRRRWRRRSRRLVGDPALARALGEAARAIACARFDERDAVDRYRALFREVAGRARPRVRVALTGATATPAAGCSRACAPRARGGGARPAPDARAARGVAGRALGGGRPRRRGRAAAAGRRRGRRRPRGRRLPDGRPSRLVLPRRQRGRHRAAAGGGGARGRAALRPHLDRGRARRRRASAGGRDRAHRARRHLPGDEGGGGGAGLRLPPRARPARGRGAARARSTARARRGC